MRGADVPIGSEIGKVRGENHDKAHRQIATKLRKLLANRAFFISAFDISATKRNTSLSGTPSAFEAGIRLVHLKLMLSGF
jgi:hypothetical protein